MNNCNNCLTIHSSHNGSVSISVDNELIVHTEISRFNKFKYSPLPSFELIEKINSLNIVFDTILITYQFDNCLGLWKDFVKKYINKTENCKILFSNEHHLFHAACALTFSSDENIIVWDQEGKIENFGEFEACENFTFYNNKLKKNFQELYTNSYINKKINNLYISNEIGLGDAYSFLCYKLGLKKNDNFPEGKAMALSSFGSFDKIEYNKLLENYNFNKNYVWNTFLDHNKNYEDYNNFLLKDFNDTKTKNFVYTFQKCFEELSLKKIESLNIQNFTATGGVSQNILNNSNLAKSFNLKVDPMCNDQGISLGSLNTLNNNNLKRKHPIYLGFEPKYDLSIFDMNFKIINSTVNEISKILFNEPIAIFQGRSEQGQRALGNRSLLINPCLKNCIKIINTIKKREWYRTFACSILNEKFSDYFENPNNTDPRFMMFVYKAKKEKIDILKNVISPENLSRVQTVSANDNLNYYNLLNIFNKNFNIPFILNTSLNKPGDVIVEDLNDLKRLMLKTPLKYAYLPDINKVIKKI